MDSKASFSIGTGGQKGHVMWILTNQQGTWTWSFNALQLPSEKMLWNSSIEIQLHLRPINVIFTYTSQFYWIYIIACILACISGQCSI